MFNPQTTQLAQLLQLLAQMLAEIAAMHNEQAVLHKEQLDRQQGQAEQQKQVLERLTGTASLLPPPPLAVLMHRMGKGDGPQIFLETFRPPAAGHSRGIPLACCDMGTTVAVTAPGRVGDGCEPANCFNGTTFRTSAARCWIFWAFPWKVHPWSFQARWMAGEDQLLAWARQLHNAVARCLQPGLLECEARMLVKVVLEQFLEGLPGEMASWLRCHRRASLEAVVIPVDDHLAVQVDGAGSCSQPASRPPPVEKAS